MSRISVVLVLALTTGCLTAGGDTGTPIVTDGDLTAIMAEIDTLRGRLDAAEGTIAALQTENASMAAALAALPSDVASQSYVDASDADLQAQIDGIDGFSEEDLLAYLTDNGYLNALPADLVTTKGLEAALDALGAYTDADVAAYLLANGYLNSLPADLVYASTLAGYATLGDLYSDADVLDYLRSMGYPDVWPADLVRTSDLTAYAMADDVYTDADVAAYLIANGYVDELPADLVYTSDLGPYASIAYVNGEIAGLEGAGYVTISDVADFVDVGYVQGLGFVLESSTAWTDLVDDVEVLAGATIEGDYAVTVDDCDALQAELAALGGARISGAGTVTITVAAGTHLCDGEVVVSHPDGDRLQIRGDGGGTTLKFALGNGIRVSARSALGGFAGRAGLQDVTFVGPHFGGVPEDTYDNGLIVDLGASLTVGPNVAVSSFSRGVVCDGTRCDLGSIMVYDTYIGVLLAAGVVRTAFAHVEGEVASVLVSSGVGYLESTYLEADLAVGALVEVKDGGFVTVYALDGTSDGVALADVAFRIYGGGRVGMENATKVALQSMETDLGQELVQDRDDPLYGMDLPAHSYYPITGSP